eukprot:9490701-Pyramimonas_sp.AAC.1
MARGVLLGLLAVCALQCGSAAVPSWVSDVAQTWQGGSDIEMLQFCVARAASLLRSGLAL